MNGGVRLSIAGTMLGLLALAGCGRGFFQGGEREPWRHEAEIACMKSGSVKLGAGVVQIEPIEGPGICGADFPLKVAALGEPPLMSFADDPVPPGSIPNGTRMPSVPPGEPHYAPPARIDVAPNQKGRLNWVTGPPGIDRSSALPSGAPMQLNPQQDYAPPPPVRAAPMPPPTYVPPAAQSRALPSDIPPDAVIPPGGSAAVPQQRAPGPYPLPPPPRNSYNAPGYEPPRLGPPRAPLTTASIPQASLTPPA